MAGLGKPEPGVGEIPGAAFSADIFNCAIPVLLHLHDPQRFRGEVRMHPQFGNHGSEFMKFITAQLGYIDNGASVPEKLFLVGDDALLTCVFVQIGARICLNQAQVDMCLPVVSPPEFHRIGDSFRSFIDISEDEIGGFRGDACLVVKVESTLYLFDSDPLAHTLQDRVVGAFQSIAHQVASRFPHFPQQICINVRHTQATTPAYIVFLNSVAELQHPLLGRCK